MLHGGLGPRCEYITKIAARASSKNLYRSAATTAIVPARARPRGAKLGTGQGLDAMPEVLPSVPAARRSMALTVPRRACAVDTAEIANY